MTHGMMANAVHAQAFGHNDDDIPVSICFLHLAHCYGVRALRTMPCRFASDLYTIAGGRVDRLGPRRQPWLLDWRPAAPARRHPNSQAQYLPRRPAYLEQDLSSGHVCGTASWNQGRALPARTRRQTAASSDDGSDYAPALGSACLQEGKRGYFPLHTWGYLTSLHRSLLYSVATSK